MLFLPSLLIVPLLSVLCTCAAHSQEQPEFFSYEGIGERNLELLSYQQAVRIGDRIEISGQGGWDQFTGGYNNDTAAHIHQAFKMVDIALKDAGGDGWSQVYRVTSYHVPLDSNALQIMAKEFKAWMPDHSPIWTAVGAAQLSEKEMQVEIEVVAYVGK